MENAALVSHRCKCDPTRRWVALERIGGRQSAPFVGSHECEGRGWTDA